MVSLTVSTAWEERARLKTKSRERQKRFIAFPGGYGGLPARSFPIIAQPSADFKSAKEASAHTQTRRLRSCFDWPRFFQVFEFSPLLDELDALRQLHISGHAEGAMHSAFGIPLPAPFFRRAMPAYTMVGGRIFYERALLEKFIADGRIQLV
jgi:hypothetical protein